jgi:hypothetical protein
VLRADIDRSSIYPQVHHYYFSKYFEQEYTNENGAYLLILWSPKDLL